MTRITKEINHRDKTPLRWGSPTPQENIILCNFGELEGPPLLREKKVAPDLFLDSAVSVVSAPLIKCPPGHFIRFRSLCGDISYFGTSLPLRWGSPTPQENIILYNFGELEGPPLVSVVAYLCGDISYFGTSLP